MRGAAGDTGDVRTSPALAAAVADGDKGARGGGMAACDRRQTGYFHTRQLCVTLPLHPHCYVPCCVVAIAPPGSS